MRVVFVNDVGFQFGAGTAHLRQIQSLLLLGHEVAALCCYQGAEEQRVAFGRMPPPQWLGLREFRDLHWEREPTDEVIHSRVVEAVRALKPDAVVVGNLHAARWPVSLLAALRDASLPVVAFMHDGHFASGRCAYPGECRLYETGCDETCPTATEYPALEPARIPAAWRLRREIFSGPKGVALAANSDWTLGMARRALPGLERSSVLYYGVDERLFKPLDRALARRLLGVPESKPVIVAGAVSMKDRRKGGHVLKEVVAALAGEAHFLVFGHAAAELGNVQGTGYFHDFRRMPLVYSAADIFLGTSLEEAFGQTYCEAAACGLPVVGFRVGGVPEIARHDLNARLVEPGDVEATLAELRRLLKDPGARAELGEKGRALVESEFTLRRQGERWLGFLQAMSLS
jgi:glycosyltransferase involved in cell wall biosynthesis